MNLIFSFLTMGTTTSQEYTCKPNIPITCDLARGQTSLHPAGFELVTSKEMLFTIKPSEVLLNLMLISIKNIALRHIGLKWGAILWHRSLKKNIYPFKKFRKLRTQPLAINSSLKEINVLETIHYFYDIT